MEKPQNDILQEKYKGPSAVVTGAGYVYLTHLVATIAGFAGLGAIGLIASNKTIAVKKAFSEFSAANKVSDNILKKIPGHIAGWIPYVADAISSKVVGSAKKLGNIRGKVKIPAAGEQTSSDKMNAFMFAGGIGGATGWIGSTILSVIAGGHKGNEAKRQFNRAKEEIQNLREDNADLNKINDDLHAKYVKAATRLDTIQAAQDASRNDALLPVNETPATSVSPASAPTTQVQLDQKQHDGKLVQHELAVA